MAAVWEAFFGGLRAWILGLGFIAILLAAAAAMARERDPLVPARRALALATRTPATPWARAGRAVAVGAVSLVFVLQPTLALQIVAVLIGAYGLFFAACELLALIAPPAGAGAEPPARPRCGSWSAERRCSRCWWSRWSSWSPAATRASGRSPGRPARWSTATASPSSATGP